MGQTPLDAGAAERGAARLRPSFRRASADELEGCRLTYDAHFAQYGYHDGSDVEQPQHLVRYIEPTEDQFDAQVEYDMDEQDQQWLDHMNAKRRAEQLDVISYEAFEIILDRLEKEWFALVKRIPSRFSIGAATDEDEYPEDTYCAICDDGEGENLNAIVFCDGCNLAVHQDCYGVPYIPEGQWLCRKCTVSPDRPVSCVLCPNEGGAFKQTTENTWAHLLCAMWIPETGVANSVFMEPIDGVRDIPKARWRLRCYLCHRQSGACIQCEHRTCFTAFHVMCARRAGLLVSRRHRADGTEADNEPIAAYCHHHLPKVDKVALRARIRGTNDDGSDSDLSSSELAVAPRRPPGSASESIVSKSSRAYNKLYSSGPLPVPNYIVTRVLEYIARIPIRRKGPTVSQIVRYWSLKRQQMRGAPLLKRLHIEPWTVGHFIDERTSALKLAKLQYLFRLREDLEKVRLLAELVRRREKTKMRQARLFQEHVMDGALLCRAALLRHTLERIMALDRAQWFAKPVSVADAPDYYDVITNPMDWSCILCKIETFAYESLDDFEADVRLVCSNATVYNRADSPIYKAAVKLEKQLPLLMSEARQAEVAGLGLRQAAAPSTASASDSSAAAHESLPHALEPSLELVQWLGDPVQPCDDMEDKAIGAPESCNRIHAFLAQWYTVPAPPPAEVPDDASPEVPTVLSKERAARRPRAEPTRRSMRHAETLPSPRRSPRHTNLTVAPAVQRNVLSEAEPLSSRHNARRETASAPLAPRRSARQNQQAETAHRAPPESLDKPQVLRDINDHDSFKYFNTGWLLPPGTRRGNRPRPPPPVRPPRAKRARRDVRPTRASERQRQSAIPADDSSLSELSEA